MWTYASLEAESEGLVEHTALSVSSPSISPNIVLFGVAAWLRRRERGGGNGWASDSEDAALSVDRDGPCALRS